MKKTKLCEIMFHSFAQMIQGAFKKRDYLSVLIISNIWII